MEARSYLAIWLVHLLRTVGVPATAREHLHIVSPTRNLRDAISPFHYFQDLFLLNSTEEFFRIILQGALRMAVMLEQAALGSHSWSTISS